MTTSIAGTKITNPVSPNIPRIGSIVHEAATMQTSNVASRIVRKLNLNPGRTMTTS